MTVREFIKSSMRLIGVIATGETPGNEELNDAFTSLNDMLESWANERLLLHAKVREEFSLVASTQSYTLGPSLTFNTSRPAFIDAATIEDQSNTPTQETSLEIINAVQWAEIKTKDNTSKIPKQLYIERSTTADTLYFYPKPSAANKLVLYSQKPFTAVATLNTTVAFPIGYARALRYNLAIELAPEYGKTPSPEVVTLALEAKENLKRQNIQSSYMKVDSALISGGTFDINSGE